MFVVSQNGHINLNNLPYEGQHVIVYDSLNQETVSGFLVHRNNQPVIMREWAPETFVPLKDVKGWVPFPNININIRSKLK